MNALASDAARICRLRVRTGQTEDALNLRLQLERVLASADIRPASVPSGAILCVRRLPRVAVPVQPLRMQRAMDLHRWQSRVRQVLGRCASNAARPAHGAVSSEVDAVIFAGVAELLGCLARDWLRGDAAGHWWWRSLFPGRALDDAVQEAWLKNIQSVPAAMARLEDEALAHDLLRELPRAVAGKIAGRLARTFALESLHEAVTRAVVAGSARPPAQDVSQDDPVQNVRASVTNEAGKESPRRPPWSPWVRGESPPVEPQVLFVLSMMLHRAPAVARSLRFVGLVCEFAAEQEARSAGHSLPSVCVEFSGEQTTVSRNETILRTHSPAAPVSGERQLDAEVIATTAPSHDREIEFRGQSSPARAVDAPTLSRTAATRREIVSASQAAMEEIICPTQWGGVFYLVNLALALGYYGDFTQPGHRSLPLPVWDFLALIGRELIGPEFEQDRLWNMLVTLAGRAECEPVGAWFSPDLESNADADAPDSPLDRWTHQTANLIVTHLAQLEPLNRGGVQAEAHSEALRELVLHRAAQVLASSERVTVHFSLAEHPIELRLAVLDRDPGWVPAAGRAIFFEYD